MGGDGKDVAVAIFILTAEVNTEAAGSKTTLTVEEVEVAGTELILTVVSLLNHKTRPQNLYAIDVE